MAEEAAAVSDFRVGRVLSRSFSTLFRNIASFGLLAVVISSPTYVYAILAGPTAMAMPTDPLDYWPLMNVHSLIVSIANFLLGYLVVAALVYGTVQDLKHRSTGFGECFSRGVSLMLPAIGIAIVMLLILALVLVATFVPGMVIIGVFIAGTGSTAIEVLSIVSTVALFLPALYVRTMLWVTIPVAVIERRGLGSFRRSAALTKGSRWRIFLLVLLLIVVGIGVSLLLWAVAVTTTGIDLAGRPGARSASFVGPLAIKWIATAFSSAFAAVIEAVAYHDLRVAKEGADSEQIAAVFD